MSTVKKKVLVGTLFHGEAEFPLCLETLKRQQGVSFNSFVVENLPNKEAHDTIYRKFMENAGSYEYFLKLDADMVLRADNAVRFMIDLMAQKNAAHLMMDVMDWPSQLSIPGIQLFRSDTQWPGSDDKLNVDYFPKITGKSMRVTETTVVDHMPYPSNFQSFRYGLHKAFKSLQPDRRDKDPTKIVIHSSILAGIARHWLRSRDNRLIWMLIAAMLVYEGELKNLMHDYSGAEAEKKFNTIASDGNILVDLAQRAEMYWRNEIQSNLRCAKLAQETYWL